MKLVEVKDWQLIASEEIWGLLPFKKLLTRDKSKDKETAMKEVLFVFFFCDIKSNYLLMKENDRIEEIKKDIGLPKSWKIDKAVQDCIDLYLKEESAITTLYKQTLKAAEGVGKYLENTDALLNERDVHGKPIYDIAKITAAVDKVPKLMANLKVAYKEVIKEQEDTENKKKGSRSYNVFEDGLQFDGDN